MLRGCCPRERRESVYIQDIICAGGFMAYSYMYLVYQLHCETIKQNVLNFKWKIRNSD